MLREETTPASMLSLTFVKVRIMSMTGSTEMTSPAIVTGKFMRAQNDQSGESSTAADTGNPEGTDCNDQDQRQYEADAGDVDAQSWSDDGRQHGRVDTRATVLTDRQSETGGEVGGGIIDAQSFRLRFNVQWQCAGAGTGSEGEAQDRESFLEIGDRIDADCQPESSCAPAGRQAKRHRKRPRTVPN